MLARRSLSLLFALAMLAPHPAAAQSAPVSAWPLRVDTSAGQLSVYQPQPETFEGDELSARAAVSLLPPGATEPEFGATWFKARVFTDRDARTVTIQDLDVRQVKLPNSPADQEAGFAAVLKGQLPQMNVTFSLDQLEASLGVVQKARVESQQLDNTPPKILVTRVPTTLVVLDGEPKLQPADDVPGVLRVVNTPFIMLLDGGTKQYYLKAGEAWMAAPAYTGPWQSVASIPAEVAQEGAKLSVQNQPAPDQQPAAAAAPANAAATQILVATEPTELIASDGPPQYTPLPGNDLLYMANTQSDVFLEVSTQRTFVLLAGRWFVAPGLNGPWQFVASDALPPSFAQIPDNSPKANVLVCVAGTQRAADARMDAYIPQTTAIHRDAGNALQVSYDGDPQFVPVAEGSPLAYATNCADPVLSVDNSYYCCHQAVWYRASAAVGPWVVSVSVPQVIYTIPPSCPVYHCRYVYVYDSTPDVVYCGYLPGYTGCYVYGPTVVYGTGYAYPYWYHREFIPRPVTWGFAPRYDYYSATWGLGAARRYDATWFAAGPVAERHDWWGPSGYVDYHEIHQSRTTIINNYYGGRTDVRREDIRRGPAVINKATNVTINRINIYNRQENAPRNVFVNNSRTTVNNVRNTDVRNTDVRNTNVRDTDVRENNVRTDVRNGDRGAPAAAAPRADDVYAGRDGQVYRRTDQGWQQRGTKGWSQVNGVPDAHVDPTPPRNARVESPSQRDTPPQRAAPPQRDVPAQRDAPPAGQEVPRGRDRPAPSRAEPPPRAPVDNGGLEADHVARERGSARSGGGDDDAPSRSNGGPPPSRGGGNAGTANNVRGSGGGGGGAGNGGGNGGGSNNNGKIPNR